MTDYKPQAGDLVRRTYPNGTTLQGVISEYHAGTGTDSWGHLLYNTHAPDETELLHRPFKFKNEVGTCYRHRCYQEYTFVKVDNHEQGWLGFAEISGRWFSDDCVREVVESGEWEEHPLSSD